MHSCLQIDEIVRKISGYVEPRISLVHMALACKAFYEPAMDACWHTLPDLSPLLRCLPEELHISTEDAGTSEDWCNRTEYWDAHRPPLPEECVSLNQHAVRVRKLSVETSSEEGAQRISPYVTIGSYCLTRLVESFNRRHVFPNLEELHYGPDVFDASAVALFIVPSIRKITFTGRLQNPLGVLDLVTRRAPLLESFAYPVPCKRLDYPPWSKIFTLGLAALSSPQQLTLHLNQADDHDAMFSHLSYNPFPSLEKLHVSIYETPITTYEDIGSCLSLASFVKSFSCVPLKSLKVYFDGTITNSALRALCAAMSSFRTPLQYCSLSVDSICFNEGDTPLETSALDPLMSVRHLQELIFYADAPAFVSTDIQLVGQSWPEMVKLVLVPPNSSRPSDAPLPLECLVTLAELCPRLEELSVYVADFATAPKVVSHIPPQRALRILRLGWSQLSRAHTLEFAKFVVHLFPNAEIRYTLWDAEERAEWKGIVESVGGKARVFGLRDFASTSNMP